eukprot:10265585-Lingulodinium_polyedra.AAC.1
MQRYLLAGRSAFGDGRISVVSLAADATRLSGEDTLASCLYSPELDMAMWCPPVVGAPSDPEPGQPGTLFS